MSSRANLLVLSERLLRACEDGSEATVRSLVPQLYPTSESLTSPDVVPMGFVMATAAQHRQASILQYLFESVPLKPKRQFPWDLPIQDPERIAMEHWKVAQIADIVVLQAAHSGSPDVVQKLLDAGMPVDYEIEKTGTSLVIAVSNQSQDLTKFLLRRGADANTVTYMGRYPLITFAAAKPSLDIVTALLEYGADLPGSGALVAAAETGNIQTVEVLLEKGSDIDETRRYGMWQDKEDTSLHAAVRAGKTDMAMMLVSRGINQNLRNDRSQTARDIANENNKTEMLNILDEID